jgi:hypothetical protein
VPKLLIEDNRKKWSGEHLIDPSLVPGVIFINKKIDIGQPAIIDVAPTVLGVFDVDNTGEMQGKNFGK